jgi:quercetin dioxygenase-like cupin family protein
MRIVSHREIAPAEQRSKTFEGIVWAESVYADPGITVANILFCPGGRTFWHSHQFGQLLFVLAGRGLVCARGEEPIRIEPGTYVWTEAGEQHWHGAEPGYYMSHIAISLGTTTWLDQVTQVD